MPAAFALPVAAVGTDLWELQMGVNAGKHLDPLLPKAYVQMRYSYAIVQKELGIRPNRSRIETQVGYFLTRRLSAQAIAGLFQIRVQFSAIDRKVGREVERFGRRLRVVGSLQADAVAGRFPLPGLREKSVASLSGWIDFDNDPPGREGASRAIEAVTRSADAPDLRVLEPERLDGAKDPDAFVRRSGIARCRTLVCGDVTCGT